MATIGVRMGNQALHDTVRRFGFGERTGIECPGESPGLVREVSKWDSFSTTSVPFGYEITATPLQLITAFSAIITDGVLVKPKLVHKLVGPDGTIVESFETPKIVRRSVSSRIARYIAQEALVGVAEKPSLRRALAGPHRVLGKTGTAKLLYADRGLYEPGAYLSLFIGAAPASDPQVVALVMVRRPKASLGYYGAVVSAPGVGEILTATLAYLEVAPVEQVALGRGE
ncbi:MAG: hypothetical protein IIB38_10440 [Candidatus Hydrogenedentes bacterium]|nr:hypothetical protein [Candidatus Hydrogenedentota bacterium]